MARVFIPATLRDLCKGRSEVEVPGATLRQIVENLSRECPGIGARILQGGEMRPDLALAVNGVVGAEGLLERVPEGAEIQIMPAIAGGSPLQTLPGPHLAHQPAAAPALCDPWWVEDLAGLR